MPQTRTAAAIAVALALAAGPAAAQQQPHQAAPGAGAAQSPVVTAAPTSQGDQLPAAAVQAGIQRMAPHRAAYTLQLGRSRDGGIVAVQGAMLFEVADACEGWATRQRLSMTLVDRDGQQIDTLSDYATYESKDGRSFRFSLTQTTQGAVSTRVAGEAELDEHGAGRVRFSEPVQREEELPPGTMLPMRHTAMAVEAARAGRRLLMGPLFDGTSDEGAQDTTTVIAGWQPAPAAAPGGGTPDKAEAGERFPLLSGLASARMRVAFFERGLPPGGAAAPEYEVGLRYYENGVANDLQMDFGDFTVDGRLEELQELPGGC